MTDQSLFSEENKNVEVTPPVNTPAPNPLEDLLKGIKNEQGEQKYSSLEDALKALQHSQAYIPELKNQLTDRENKIKELEMEQTRLAQLEEAMERLATVKPHGDGKPPTASVPDEQTLKSLVAKQLEEIDSVKRAESNMAKVQDALVAKFGDKAPEVLASKAAELGTTKEALGALAKQNPQMVLAYFNTPASTGPKPSTNSVNVPPINKQTFDVEKPSKSMLLGATDRDRVELLSKIRESVHSKLGVNQ